MRRLSIVIGLSALAVLAGLLVWNPRVVAQANERIFGSLTTAGGGNAIAITATADGYANVLCPDCSGGGGTPSAPVDSVQFNDAGSFGGSANLTWNNTTKLLSVGPTSNDPFDGDPVDGLTHTTAFVGSLVDYSPGSDQPRGLVSNVTVHTPSGTSTSITSVGAWLSTLAADANDYVNFVDLDVTAVHNGSGNLSQLYGVGTDVEHAGAGTISKLWAVSASAGNFGAGNVTVLYAVQATLGKSGSGTTATAYAFQSEDLADVATNAYYSWHDSRGVGVCKEDATFDSVGQDICRVYNPQSTKYTPGLANYERTVYGQWNGNVAEIGAEAGGTGVLRPIKLIGASVTLPAITTATAFKTDTTTAHTALFQAYDTDTGPGYVTFGTLLNGTAPSFTIAPPAGGGTVSVTGGYVTAGAAPSVANVGANSCGTTAATIAGNNNAGEITVGSVAGTQCRVTFTIAAPTRRVCTVTDATTTIATRATYVDTTHSDFFGAFVAGDVVAYHCFAN